MSRRLLLLLVLLIAACSRVDPVRRELDRLAAVPGLEKPQRDAIAKARAAKAAELRLYRLRDAYVGVETQSFIAAHAEAKRDLAKVTALWTAAGPEIAARPAAHGSPMQRALVQSSANRAEKLYRASLPYGKADGPFSGLYYLAEAEANARFGKFVASIAGDDEPRTYALNATLQTLERDMLRAFEADPTGRTTIAVSTRVKESRELLDRDLFDGAALLLAEARMKMDRAPDERVPELLAAMPAGRTTRPPKRGVKITLVRWPYT